MRLNKVGVISLLLVSLLLASCAPSPGPSEGIWETVLEIGSLGFLNIGDAENNIVAFVRILLGVLIFALLYMGASAVPGLKEQRNIAITVSIILAIISVIFIPASILVGIGSAYSTLFALVLLGAPIVAIFLLYRTLNESSIVLKLGLLIILLLILIAVKTTSEGYLTEDQRISLGALHPLVQGIAALVDWGIGIVVFMMIMEIVKAFHRSGGTSAVGGGLAGAGKWVAGIGKRKARNVQKKEINEYILEEKEQKDLDELKGEALHILTEFEAVANRGDLSSKEKDNIVKMTTNFGEMLTETKRTFRNLSKRTSRADNGLDKMFDYFKKKGIKVPEEVKALENNILKLHQETAQEIAKVDVIYRQILNSPAMTTFKSMTDDNFGEENYKVQTGSSPFNLAQLHLLIKGFQDERFLLEDAYKKQTEAKKELTGIIQETRDLYK